MKHNKERFEFFSNLKNISRKSNPPMLRDLVGEA